MGKRDELFRDLCENAHDLIQSVSPEGKFVYVNRAWLETLGYTREEVGRLNVFDVIHPDSRAHCEAMLQSVMAGEPAADIEAEFVTKDGRRVLVEGSARCIFERGRPAVTCGIFRNVTDSRRAEDELERMFNLSLDLLCIAGTDGYFKQVNPAFETVLGYTREELLSRQFIDFVHPDDREDTLREVANLAAGRPVVDFQNRYRAKDGSWKWLAWRSTPSPGGGLIYAVARDITRRKRDEQLMARQAAELARSNEDLEQFAYVASHDLRAPLRAIGNLAGFIEEDMPDELPAKVRKHLHKLRGRVQRMEKLTEDLLEYSRAGRQSEELRRVKVEAIVRDLTALLSPPDGITVRAADGAPDFVTAAMPLEQVLRNLIGNAIKHHDRDQGEIIVSVRDAGEFWEFSVADDGPGIPAEHRERVFQMFQQLQSRDRVEGTGLGLALVKRIVEGHGGRAWVESDGERGSVFFFTWPKRIEVEDADDSGR